ncbi:AAA domain-containing protein [Candidatus Parcubacteria bacterium]|nr:AAA domain-containing protein [Candidatus Parcubacteria bacterium]
MVPPFKNFTSKAREAIKHAHELAIERGQNHVNPIHLLSSLVMQDESMVISILDKMKVDSVLLVENLLDMIEVDEKAETLSPSFSMYLAPELAQIIEHSTRIAANLKDDFVSTEHLFLAFFDVKNQATPVLETFKIKKEEVLEVLDEVRKDEKKGVQSPKTYKSIKKYTVSLTEKAKNNKIDPVIGRDQEINRVIQILSRRTKNNPIMIGEPGVGKTAIVEGLANRIAQGDVPESLKDKDLVSLDLGSLVAGTKYRGEFEDRLKKIIKEVTQAEGKIILFIDEIHTLAGAGASEGSLDASNMLKPALARGELKAIGATTLKEYQKYIEKDGALTRRFQPVNVAEPSIEDAIAIMRGIKEKYELYHGVRISDDAIVASVELSSRYISDRFLPDKAVDLIDESSSTLKISLENMPPELENTRRKIMRLEIEKEAINSENKKSKKTTERLNKIKKEIADLKEGIKELELKWKNEKETIISIKTLKSDLEQSRLDAEAAESQADLAKAAEIRYGIIPNLEKELKIKEKRLKRLQSSRQILKEEITEEDIAGVVSRWTGIPVSKMLEEEVEKLSKMESELRDKIIGQENAINKISNTIRRSRAGVADPNRPIGSFIFLGPTGVGKTELTKTLAEFMFNDEKSLIRVDMSEFMEKHSISKLIGAPPGYVGHEESGSLTETVRHRPYSIILFDEIEKAHPEVFNILLQVLDNGRLTDGKGRTVNFKNTVIILTSNIGAEYIDKMEKIGFASDTSAENQYKETKVKVEKALKEHFRPEFLNRLDDVVIFDILSREAIKKIVKIQINEVKERLDEKGIGITVSPKVIEYLGKEGYDPHYGARPLKRLIQTKILDPLAQLIIKKHVSFGQSIKVGIKKDEFYFDIKKGSKVTSVSTENAMKEEVV